MTIRHLRIFIKVAECGKMNQAAKALYIAQPTVSQTIAELEKYYGVLLFERLSQRLYITENGRKLFDYARHVVDAFDSMDRMMKKEGQQQIFRVGASVSVGTCMLGAMIRQLEESDVKIQVNAVVHNTSKIESMILESKLDVGVVEGVVESKELIQIPICEDELVVVVGKRHPFYNRESISLFELDGRSVISREDGSTNRNQYEQLLEQNKIVLEQKWICTNTEAIKRAVSSGKELAILSKMLVEQEVKDGTLKILNVENINVHRKIQLIYHQNKYMSEIMKEFIKICKM